MINVILLQQKILEKTGRKDFGNCVAELTGLSESSASNKLNGKTRFHLDDVKAIAKGLDLTIEDVDNIFMGEID